MWNLGFKSFVESHDKLGASSERYRYFEDLSDTKNNSNNIGSSLKLIRVEIIDILFRLTIVTEYVACVGC
jgi:hypothetical protein